MKSFLLSIILCITCLVSAQNSIEKTVGEFTELKVFDLINVTMIKSNENKVIISGKNKSSVRIINRNGKLKIRMELEESYDGNDTDITLYYSNVDVIDANEGANIEVKDVLDQFEVELKAQEGGEITAKLKTTMADVRAVTGGIINISGTSKQQKVSIYTGGILNAEDFKTETTEINVNAGGDASINASELVEVKIRAGGDVYIYGNPKEIDEERVLGGRVRRMK